MFFNIRLTYITSKTLIERVFLSTWVGTLLNGKLWFWRRLSSAATPVITASANTYEIGGSTTVTLTCASTSDTGGSGTYEWKKDGNVE